MSEKNVIALGFFDGVHLGHGALLKMTAERASALGAHSAAFTFDRSPKEFVTGKSVPLLTDAEARAEWIRGLYGIDSVIVAPFDREMMTMPWEDFLTMLVEKHGAVHLVAGHDYRFGHKNAGDVARLAEWCAAHGLGCDVIPKVELDGTTVSSTYIRTLVESGDVERAARFLGHPHTFAGAVCHGCGLGTKRLFPTANLRPGEHTIIPAHGVYAVRVLLDGREYAGVTNVGVRPTVSDGNEVTFETYVLDFSGDLYGKRLRLEFLKMLRGEQRFADVRALHDQIARDIKSARAVAEKA